MLDTGRDFSELAKEKSTGPSGPSGGELGWFGAGQMVKPFADAAATMDKGTYSKTPVQTEFGWHVIMLDDVRDSTPPPFEDVKDRLKILHRQPGPAAAHQHAAGIRHHRAQGGITPPPHCAIGGRPRPAGLPAGRFLCGLVLPDRRCRRARRGAGLLPTRHPQDQRSSSGGLTLTPSDTVRAVFIRSQSTSLSCSCARSVSRRRANTACSRSINPPCVPTRNENRI